MGDVPGQAARQIHPEAAPATELSTHRQMAWCSNSLSELITLPPEGQLHSGTVSHFPAKCVFFPIVCSGLSVLGRLWGLFTKAREMSLAPSTFLCLWLLTVQLLI